MKLGLIGAGRWGENLIRNFVQLGVLSTICDTNDSALNKINKRFPTVKLTKSFLDIINDPSINAVVISAPTKLHEEFAKLSLRAGKHVYVEKPLARNEKGAIELMQMADELNLVLMVGHLLLYHPAVNKLKELIGEGALGEIRYLNSDRRNFSSVRGDTNVIWDLAPHDISMINYILSDDNEEECEIELLDAKGFSTSNDNVFDVAHLDLCFKGNISAHIHNTWIDPLKQCLLTVNGSKKTAVLNDVDTERKLSLYSMLPDGQILEEHPIYIKDEPLRLECEHFLDCVKSGKRPLSDAFNGYKVVRILEKADFIMNQKSFA